MSTKKLQRKNTLWDIQLEVTKDGRPPIAFPEKMDAFEKHRKVLLENLLGVRGRKSETFDAARTWCDLTQVAKLYYHSQTSERGVMSGAERGKRLRQLERALRLARGLTDRAMKDDLEFYLRKAWCVESDVPIVAYPIETDGSSVLMRKADELKTMAATLATLQTIARAALTNDKPDKGGRSTVLSRDLIQGLARVYRTSTGAKPGRGAGPFADFVSEFALAVGKTGFSRRSLIGAIQDAHLQFKPSWFDGNPPPS